MPPMEMYGPDMMKRESRDEFVNWYHHQVTTHIVFDFRKEIIEYCRSDVDILRRCCLKFRTLFQKECGLDPFLHSFTIAAACNKVYRHRFLKPVMVLTYSCKPAHSYLTYNHHDYHMAHYRDGRVHVGTYQQIAFPQVNYYDQTLYHPSVLV